ncbi:MAG TPA: YqgE/AlgH family protein [Planctomicrobium sp.]|nr:YqgE/AlgH family protein [Planctomicrobium sp.]
MSDSLRGQFLVAGCGLRDPNFFKTVVLIVEHGPDGAMGLVVNRPSSVTVAHALTGHLDLPKTKDMVYCGGPVEPAALFVIHDCGNLDPDETPVVPGVYMGSSAEVFENIVCPNQDKPQCKKYRVYCGCAGWGSGQLEDEMERGDWLVLPAQAGFVFHADPYAVWDELISCSYRAKRLLPLECEHPEWN